MKFETILKNKYNINPSTYMEKARKRAASLGYNINNLSFSDDGKHKMDYDGISFGNVDNKDFIIYSLISPEKAYRKKKAYHARMFADIPGREITKKMRLTRILW